MDGGDPRNGVQISPTMRTSQNKGISAWQCASVVYPDTERKTPINTYSPLQGVDKLAKPEIEEQTSSGEKVKSRYEKVLEFNQVRSPKKAVVNMLNVNTYDPSREVKTPDLIRDKDDTIVSKNNQQIQDLKILASEAQEQRSGSKTPVAEIDPKHVVEISATASPQPVINNKIINKQSSVKRPMILTGVQDPNSNLEKSRPIGQNSAP